VIAGTSSAREFAQLLGPLRRAVLRATRQAAGLPDLSEPQIEVLRLLENGPMAPTQLARALQMAPSTLSNLLKAMTDAGLIKRARQNDDQRRVNVAISRRARGLLNTYDTTSLNSIERFLEQLSDDERSAFDAAVPVLQRMCASFAGVDQPAAAATA
jgi:DNA-binding MarR family transcriptional regulator